MTFGSDISGEQTIKWDVLINVEMKNSMLKKLRIRKNESIKDRPKDG